MEFAIGTGIGGDDIGLQTRSQIQTEALPILELFIIET